VWTGLIWLRIGASAELGNYRVATQLVVSRVVLSSIEMGGWMEGWVGCMGGWVG
jgi:hypothetical protein